MKMSESYISKLTLFCVFYLHLNCIYTLRDNKHHQEKNGAEDTTIFIEQLFTKYGNTTFMTYEGFEHLMHGIELGNIILEDSVHAHYSLNNTNFKSLHNRNHSHVVPISKQTTREKRHSDHDEHDDHNTDDLLKACLSPAQILELYGIHNHDVITRDNFLQICPALIVQIDKRRCLKMDVLIRYQTFKSPKTMGNKAWLYGFICLAIISISGLLVVSAVPLLQRLSFGGILQFFVAMAVGALTGDAMLHLFPHALAPQLEHGHAHETENDHSHENVYKGLCGLSAMFFFFLMGRIQTIIANKRTMQNNNKNSSKQHNIPEYKEKLNTEDIEIVDFEREYEVRIQHNHGHTHTEVLPNSVSGMVWRVIVGDGIHNFSDGLAIGVAFANSTTGGISTSIAVLCHELPHEMGDFAMLIKKGVSIKRALCFNCLSSVLSCIGMVIGIAVGNMGAVTLWIFVAVGAMFIYISLVDMIPELTALSDGETNSWKRLIIQICGLMLGTGIMLTIALYEEQLINMLG